MAYLQGTASATGGGHFNLLADLRTFLTTTVGWTEKRYTVIDANNIELLYMAPGSGSEQIYIQFYLFQNIASNYYSLGISTAIGYLSGNTYWTQPGVYTSWMPVWASAIPYTFIANGSRCIIYTNVSGNDQSGYVGKLLPYATPSQWPYPVICAGMTQSSSTLYSDNSAIAWFKGSRSNCAMRFVDGNYRTPQIIPAVNTEIIRNTKADSNATEGAMPGYYGLSSLILSENTYGYINNYGEFEGAYFISGWSNTSGNTLTISGTNYLVIADVAKTGYKDYIALKLA